MKRNDIGVDNDLVILKVVLQVLQGVEKAPVENSEKLEYKTRLGGSCQNERRERGAATKG